MDRIVMNTFNGAIEYEPTRGALVAKAWAASAPRSVIKRAATNVSPRNDNPNEMNIFTIK